MQSADVREYAENILISNLFVPLVNRFSAQICDRFEQSLREQEHAALVALVGYTLGLLSGLILTSPPSSGQQLYLPKMAPEESIEK